MKLLIILTLILNAGFAFAASSNYVFEGCNKWKLTEYSTINDPDTLACFTTLTNWLAAASYNCQLISDYTMSEDLKKHLAFGAFEQIEHQELAEILIIYFERKPQNKKYSIASIGGIIANNAGLMCPK